MLQRSSRPRALLAAAASATARRGAWAGFLLVVLVGILGVGGSGCGQAASAVAAPAPEAARESPLLAGPFGGPAVQESLLAEVDLLGVPLGSLRSQYCPETEHSGPVQRSVMTPAKLIRAVRRSGGHATTQFASERVQHSSEYHFDDGPVALDYRVRYTPGTYTWQYDRGGRQTLRGRYSVPEQAYPHDLHSALALLRSWQPKAGQTAHFYAVMGRKLWRVEVTAQGTSMLRQGRSSRLAWRVEGVAESLWKAPPGKKRKERRFELWLSDDPTRVPLRLVADAKVGRVKLDLVDWQQAPGRCRAGALGGAGSLVAVRR